MTPTERCAPLREGWNAVSFQDMRNDYGTEFIPQLDQLALDFAISPVILTGQTHNELLDLPLSARSSAVARFLLGPFSPHQFTMPFQDPIRLHDADDLTQLLHCAPRPCLQFCGENGQGQFFSP